MKGSLDLSTLGALLGRHGVALLVLFGSRARGNERADSDLDLGALRADRRPMNLGELGRLQSDLESWSGLDAEVVDLARADALVRFEMVSDGRPLHEAEPGLWTDFVARTLIDHDDIAPFVAACVAGVGKAARTRSGR
jgi:predicted nucleotidyltransferase